MGTKKKQHIFLSSPHMTREGYEQHYIQEAFAKNWIAPLGENVDRFETEMMKKVRAKGAVALSSGTAAIHLALQLLHVQAGDIVFCTSLTFAASVNPVMYQNAEPVFIDSDYETWNMSPAALERAFLKYQSLGKKPKAVILVHLYGLSANLDEITAICQRYQCPIIEDAAESLGTKYRGQRTEGEWHYTGTFGAYGILSFNGNKIITSSGGGMLLCNVPDAEVKARKARFLATQAREAARWYEHTELGYNYRMSNIVAGIGRGQLKALEERVEKKRYIYQFYKQQLEELDGLSFMPMRDSVYSNCWLTCIQLEGTCKVRPLNIMEALERDDVESRPIWKPMHCQPLYKGADFVEANERDELREVTDLEMGADNSVCGSIFRNGLCLPSDTKMEDQDLERVCKVVRALWK